MNKKFLLITLVILIILVSGSIIWYWQKNKFSLNNNIINNFEQSSTNQEELIDDTNDSETKELSQYFYPLKKYPERIKVREYGKKVSSNDNKSLECGSSFTGYHTADDLEVTDEELREEVAVYAVTDGQVLEVKEASGYGGLIVIKHLLNNQPTTIYYGHIDLNQTTIKEGDEVKPGQLISYLGALCSSETSFERKHLHFGIHKGEEIDVRGYVDNQKDLSQWINPKEILKELKAQEP